MSWTWWIVFVILLLWFTWLCLLPQYVVIVPESGGKNSYLPAMGKTPNPPGSESIPYCPAADNRDEVQMQQILWGYS